jgi:hypothetical protein
MTTILAEIEKLMRPGTVIPKPEAKADFVVKAWGERRGSRALIYTIPNNRIPTKPYQKGVTGPEWDQAFAHLMDTGEFTRSWFNQFMPACAKEGGCNFTTIGGVFCALGYADYVQRGVYQRKHATL